ncbi:hypothetical protein [Flavitalea sp.]|nr:hypothetical protein [Flavitalea sp.]
MKKFAIIFLACIFATAISYGQCDTTLALRTIKQEMLNDKDEVVDNKNDPAKIDISKDKIVITKDNGENIMTATILNKECQWKEALKDGKSSYDLSVTFPDGRVSKGTGALEAKDGKLYFVLTFEHIQGKKIKAYIDKI